MPDPVCHHLCDAPVSGRHSPWCRIPVQTALPTIIVSGTRDATQEAHFDRINMALYRAQLVVDPGSVRFHMVEGEARGVDLLARYIAEIHRSSWEIDPVPARWEECGVGCPPTPHRRRNNTNCPVAGPRRNQLMLDRHSGAMVLALPLVAGKQPVEQDSRGTWDMIKRAVTEGRRVLIEPLPPAPPQAQLW